MDVVVRRYGNLIDFGPDARQATPADIVQILAPHLSYRYKELLRGAAAYDPVTGEYVGCRTHTRYLFQILDGRLTTQTGFINKLADVLRHHGHTPRLLDVTPPGPRPRAYEPHWEALASFKWRARQLDCVTAIVDSVLKRRGGVINAPTGFGKTTIAIALGLLFPFARIHIVVRGTGIMARIRRGLSQYFANVGQVGDGENRWGRITLISADSLHLTDGDADILLMDEVHVLMGDGYSQELAAHYMFSLNFGFSATPYARMDGCSARLDGFCGPMIFNMTYQEAVALGLVVQIGVHWLRINSQTNPAAGRRETSKKRWGVWRNDFRNAQLAAAVREVPADDQVLMLVESVEHAVYLGQMLPEFTMVYGSMKAEDAQSYRKLGQLPEDYQTLKRPDVLRLQTEFEAGRLKKVIATDVWSTGVDFEQLAVLARCDERDSDILDLQGPGRVSRIYDGKSYGRVIDCMDIFDKSLYAKSKGRRKSYRALGWDEDWPTGTRQISREME